MSRNFLSKNDELRKGDFLLSNNKMFKAIFQEDGNFVIYGWQPLWASDTDGMKDAYRLCMQHDCNFVMYSQQNKPMWHTNTYRSGQPTMCRLYLSDNGVLVIDREAEQLWTSKQSRGMK